MKKLIIILALMLLPGATAYCQQPPQQTPLTKAQIEASLQAVRIEKRYLELQVQEKNLQDALDNMNKAEPKKEDKKK